MGNIRPTIIKRTAKRIVRDFNDQLSNDFEQNKKVVAQVTDVESKSVRNKIAGYVTRLYKRTYGEADLVDIADIL